VTNGVLTISNFLLYVNDFSSQYKGVEDIESYPDATQELRQRYTCELNRAPDSGCATEFAQIFDRLPSSRTGTARVFKAINSQIKLNDSTPFEIVEGGYI